MINLNCDNCERPFEVPESAAGGKEKCPYCGDVNRVPSRVTSAHKSSPSQPESGVDSEVEQDILVIRPAMFRAHPFRYILLVSVFIGSIVLSIMAKTQSVQSWLLWPGLVFIALVVIYWLYWWVSSTMWIKLVISNKRTIRHEGIIRRHTTEVLHNHVRSVDISQNFLERIFGTGDVGIDSAGQDDIEIQIRDIPRPYEVKKIIDRYREM